MQELCEWIVGQGHEPTILVHQPAGTWRSSLGRVNGIEVCRAGCVAAPLYTPLSPNMPWHLSRIIKRTNPQVLHFHMPNPSCFWALLIPRARALPWVVHWHADVSANMPDWRVRAAYQIYRVFERALLARSTTIIATSHAYLEASAPLLEWKDKVDVVPLGIAETSANMGQPPTWPRPAGLRVLGVGRLSHYKGFAVLLDALATTPNASLVLIGDGEESTRLRAQAARLGIGDRISMIGELDDPDLLAAYAAADVLVLPSLDRSEAFGLVLLEAMRAGLAVIASDIPGSGVGQVIEHEKSGLLVMPDDARDLAIALARMNEPGLRLQLAESGHRRWLDTFTLATSAESVLAIYRRASAGHQPAATPSD